MGMLAKVYDMLLHRHSQWQHSMGRRARNLACCQERVQYVMFIYASCNDYVSVLPELLFVDFILNNFIECIWWFAKKSKCLLSKKQIQCQFDKKSQNTVFFFFFAWCKVTLIIQNNVSKCLCLLFCPDTVLVICDTAGDFIGYQCLRLGKPHQCCPGSMSGVDIGDGLWSGCTGGLFLGTPVSPLCYTTTH